MDYNKYLDIIGVSRRGRPAITTKIEPTSSELEKEDLQRLRDIVRKELNTLPLGSVRYVQLKALLEKLIIQIRNLKS